MRARGTHVARTHAPARMHVRTHARMQVSKYPGYNDPVTAQKMADDVFKILQEGDDVCGT